MNVGKRLASALLAITLGIPTAAVAAPTWGGGYARRPGGLCIHPAD